MIFANIDFKDIGFKYEPDLCNGCHYLMQKVMSFNNVAIVYIKGIAYRIHLWYMSKDDTINIMNGSILADKSGVLWFFLLYIKNEWFKCWFNLLSKKPRCNTK